MHADVQALVVQPGPQTPQDVLAPDERQKAGIRRQQIQFTRPITRLDAPAVGRRMRASLEGKNDPADAKLKRDLIAIARDDDALAHVTRGHRSLVHARPHRRCTWEYVGECR
jgi:hypothetical protein